MKTKTLPKIILFCSCAFLFISCVESNKPDPKTIKGKEMCENWDRATRTILDTYVNIAFLFNTWYEAADDQKDSIEDLYLPYYKIRESGIDTWEILSGSYVVYQITHNGKALSESGSAWNIEAALTSFDYPHYYEHPDIDSYSYTSYELVTFLHGRVNISIQALESTRWSVNIREYRSGEPEVSLVLTSTTGQVMDDLSRTPYKLSGSGKLEFCFQEFSANEYTSLSFDITEDLVNSPFQEGMHGKWGEGKLYLKAWSDDSRSKEARASFYQLSSGSFKVEILYRDVLETWDY